MTVMFFVKTSDPVQNLKKSLRYSASSISPTSFLTCDVRTTSSCVQNQNNNHNFIYLNHIYINALFTHDWLLYSVDRETPANTSLEFQHALSPSILEKNKHKLWHRKSLGRRLASMAHCLLEGGIGKTYAISLILN